MVVNLHSSLHWWKYSIANPLVWRLLIMKNWGIFWPDIYMHGECHMVQEKHYENPFWPVKYPWGSAQTPPKSKGSPLSKVKIDNYLLVPFDTSNEASLCTDCNAKNQNSFWRTVLEKIWLDRQKGPTKLDPNCSFFLIFFKTVYVHKVFEGLYEVSWSTEFNYKETCLF